MLEKSLHILSNFEEEKINLLFHFFFRGKNYFKGNLMQDFFAFSNYIATLSQRLKLQKISMKY